MDDLARAMADAEPVVEGAAHSHTGRPSSPESSALQKRTGCRVEALAPHGFSTAKSCLWPPKRRGPTRRDERAARL